jgi:hypothetical protein
MTTIEKPPLPRRKPQPSAAGAAMAPPLSFVVHFSFNNTVDPAWCLDLGTEPTSRKERRVVREAAASERGRRTRGIVA